MTALRRFLCDIGLLKLSSTGSRLNAPRKNQGRADVATIVAVSASRLELEMKKLLASAQPGGTLPQHLPCVDRSELCTSTSCHLSFGMFQNILFVLSLLCVKYLPNELNSSDASVAESLQSDEDRFLAILKIVHGVVLNIKQVPFSPFPPEFRSIPGGNNFAMANGLPCPFDSGSVLDVSTAEQDVSRNYDPDKNLGIWQNNIEPVSMRSCYMEYDVCDEANSQIKQLYWYYSQMYRGTGNPSSTNISAAKQRKHARYQLKYYD